MQSVKGLFETVEDAHHAVHQLGDAGFLAHDIATYRNVDLNLERLPGKPAALLWRNVGIGIVLGVVVSGVVGLMAAAGQRLLGFGPIVALETLVAFVLAWGLFVGGGLGLLYGALASKEQATKNVNKMSHSGFWLATDAEGDAIVQATNILTQAGATSVSIRGRSSSRPDKAAAERKAQRVAAR